MILLCFGLSILTACVIAAATGELPSWVIDVTLAGIWLAACFVVGFAAGAWVQRQLQQRLLKVSPPSK